jgi:DNA-binding NarL/FixJ family response regulator
MHGEIRSFDERLLGKSAEVDDPLAGRVSVLRMDGQRNPIDSTDRLTLFDQTGRIPAAQDGRLPSLQSSPDLEKNLLIIESRPFLRECMQRSIELALSMPVLSLSSISELTLGRNISQIRLALIFLSDGDSQGSLDALGLLSELAPRVPIVILSAKHSFETMRAVISCGAKAYIPMSVGFEIAIEAMRFVLAGGTYVPAECLLSPTPAPVSSASEAPTSGVITARELAVVRAIRQGKSNKIIAYDLNMCESTVKVHVRHIMKKLRAKNRTDVAIKAADLLSHSGP